MSQGERLGPIPDGSGTVQARFASFRGERKGAHWGIDVSESMATRATGRLAAGFAACALVLAGVPTAGLALGALDDGVSLAANGSFAALTPAKIDPKLARFVAERSSGTSRPMRFTPAGIAARPSRSVTVAVRSTRCSESGPTASERRFAPRLTDRSPSAVGAARTSPASSPR